MMYLDNNYIFSLAILKLYTETNMNTVVGGGHPHNRRAWTDIHIYCTL